jgi:hypothetical protein
VILAVAAFSTLLFQTAANAESITKSFEFGSGTQNAHSAMRTFALPCGRSVTAVVRFQRAGPDNADSDIPAKIDLREPDIAEGIEGPVVRTESVFVNRTAQTKTLVGSARDRGCSRPWRVRIRYANDGQAPFAVTGSIAVTFSDSANNIVTNSGDHFGVSPGNSKTVDFGSGSGLHQGRIQVEASWIHDIYTFVPGPLTIMLTFQLLDPSGNAVASASGCSTNNLDQSCRLVLRYNVPEHKTGQWKLKVYSGHVLHGMAGRILPKATLTPACP